MFRILKPNGNIPLDFNKNITKGLIECFVLNEYSGVDVFSSLTKNRLLNASGVSHDNGMLQYDGGVNAYTASVNMPDILFGLNQCTIIVKFSVDHIFPYNRRAFGSGDGLYQAFISQEATTNHQWYLVVLSTTGGRGIVRPSNVLLPDRSKINRMDSVALVYDNNYLSLGVNGFIEGKTPLTGTIVANQGADMYLGRIKNHIQANLKGYIEHCYIWNRALSTNELQQINNYPYSIFQDVYEEPLKTASFPEFLNVSAGIGFNSCVKLTKRDDLITNHVERSLNLLVEQFEDKEDLNNLVSALLSPIQELEYVCSDFLTLRNINNAIGVQLDIVGAIAGENREFRDDDDYREAIKIQVLLNKSFGEPETIITALKSLVNITNMQYLETFPATVDLFFVVNDIDSIPENLVEQIELIALAGVKINISFSDDNDPNFGFSDENGLSSGSNILGFGETNYPDEGGKFVEYLS